MNLPIFYESFLPLDPSFILSEETSRHILLVLRMKKDAQVRLTNGKGELLLVQVIGVHKKTVEIKVVCRSQTLAVNPNITIAMSLLKNPGRFEWFLEKATEIGVQAIIPLLCERTEKHHFRHERLNSILKSAMLQSQQLWLPQLHQPIIYDEVLHSFPLEQKFIAHCIEGDKHLLTEELKKQGDKIILIGPEGDFTKHEIEKALSREFLPVSLGSTRLRTETAGIVAATMLKLG